MPLRVQVKRYSNSTALCWLKHEFEYYISLADVRAFTFVYHESWQNDVCSLQF